MSRAAVQRRTRALCGAGSTLIALSLAAPAAGAEASSEIFRIGVAYCPRSEGSLPALHKLLATDGKLVGTLVISPEHGVAQGTYVRGREDADYLSIIFRAKQAVATELASCQIAVIGAPDKLYEVFKRAVPVIAEAVVTHFVPPHDPTGYVGDLGSGAPFRQFSFQYSGAPFAKPNEAEMVIVELHAATPFTLTPVPGRRP